MSGWRKLGLALAVSLAWLASSAQAEVRTPAKVRYQSQEGWSDWYSLEVVYAKGRELNQSTHSYDYDGFASYAVIFFARDQAAVIEIDQITMCGTEFNASCIPRFGNTTGKDQQGRNWEVCTSRYC